LLNLSEGKKAMVKGAGFNSLYGSSEIANKFNVANDVYKTAQDVDSYIDPSFYHAK